MVILAHKGKLMVYDYLSDLIEIKFKGHLGTVTPWLHIGVSTLTAAAYFSIALSLSYYLHKKRDTRFFTIFVFIVLFMTISGLNYSLDTLTAHIPESLFASYLNMATMVATIVAAVFWVPRMKDALALPTYQKTVSDLRKSERHLNDIIAAMPIPLAINDVNSNILFVNPEFISVLGYTVEDIPTVDEWWNSAYPNKSYRKQIKQKWFEESERSHKTDTSFVPMEAEIRCKNGTFKTLLCSSTPVRNEVEGTYLVFLYDITDEKTSKSRLQENTRRLEEEISERQRTQESLEQQTKQISLNFQRLESLVAILQNPCKDADDFLEYSLQEALKMTESRIGYIYTYDNTKMEFTLNSWSKGISEDCEIINERRDKCGLDTTGLWGEAVRQRCPIIDNDYSNSDNSFKKGYPEGHPGLKRFLTIPIFSNDEIVLVIGVANKRTDYTQMDVLHLTMLMDSVWKMCQHLRQEKEQELLNDKLNQNSKLEAIGRLAGGVAHDFNNKLTVIIGYMDLLKTTCSSKNCINEFQLNFMDEVIKAAVQSTEITRKLLIFSRDEPTEASKVDLNQIIEGSKKSLPRLIGEDIKTEFCLENELWRIFIDPIYVDQIVMNLSTNARDAMPDGGTLTISTSNMVIDSSYKFTIPELTPGEYVNLTVSDTGVGIDPSILSRIFEPFFTTKKIGKGTGLGLSIIYGIVVKNNGHIQVRSDLNFGTTFNIYFPRTYLTGQGIEVQKGMEEVYGKGTILIVEDEIMVLNLTESLLSHLGYTILTANSPFAAIDICKNLDTEIDLILSDIIMPEMNGKEMKDIIDEIRPKIPFLFMSGYTAELLTEKGIFEEKVEMVHKPFNMAKLSLKISNMIKNSKNGDSDFDVPPFEGGTSK
jgi:PAS domain S-box-containing protein